MSKDTNEGGADKDGASIATLGGLIRAALKAHPAFRYAVAVAGIGALVAVVTKFGASGRSLIIGAVLILALMVVFLVFAVATKAKAAAFKLPATVLVWAMTVFFILLLGLLMSSVFFNKPLPLSDWLVDEKPGIVPPQPPPTPTPAPKASAFLGFKVIEPKDADSVHITLEDAAQKPCMGSADPTDYIARMPVAPDARFVAHILGRKIEPAKLESIFSPPPGETRWYALLLAERGSGKTGTYYPIKDPNAPLPATPQAKPVGSSPKSIVNTQALLAQPLYMRCLALTMSFESGVSDPAAGFSKVSISDPGMKNLMIPVLWTLPAADPVCAVMTEINSTRPELIDAVLAGDAAEFRNSYLSNIADRKAWLDTISSGMRVKEPWQGKLVSLTSHPEFQKTTFSIIEREFKKAKAEAAALKLPSQRGVALVFDIRSLMGSLRADAKQQYQASLGKFPESSEEDRLILLASAAADTNRMTAGFKERIRERLQTVARGKGKTYGVSYDLSDYGITLAAAE